MSLTPSISSYTVLAFHKACRRGTSIVGIDIDTNPQIPNLHVTRKNICQPTSVLGQQYSPTATDISPENINRRDPQPNIFNRRRDYLDTYQAPSTSVARRQWSLQLLQQTPCPFDLSSVNWHRWLPQILPTEIRVFEPGVVAPPGPSEILVPVVTYSSDTLTGSSSHLYIWNKVCLFSMSFHGHVSCAPS